jgi:hypothetical protein
VGCSVLGLVTPERSYSPAEIAVMTEAFDKFCQSVTHPVIHDEDVRRAAARAILKYLDLGERDPTRLAELALGQLTGLNGDNIVSFRQKKRA